jgi:hypothetical protein
MNDARLIYPMFGMFVLTVIVLRTLFQRRVRAVRAKQVPIGYFATFRGAVEPDAAAQASRHFTNLFEAPVLFYVVCLAATVTRQVSLAMIVLAWAYVGARAIHSWVHLGSNRIGSRVRIYFLSWIVLAAQWLLLVVSVARLGD